MDMGTNFGFWILDFGLGARKDQSKIQNPKSKIYPLIIILLLAGCADPRLPTGGPPDKTPPALETTIPEPETVNFTDTSVRFTFSEYVDQASFTRAFSMTPEPEGRLRFKWRKRRVEIRFPEALRENTTYVLTIDKNLRDSRGLALTTPIIFAFSTGPVINKGRLSGRVLEPAQGNAAPGFDVFAYALADSAALDSLPERPAYRTQTDDNGRFSLSYLNEQPYFVLALQDRNRSLRPDANEPFAVPPVPAIDADEDSTATAGLPPWLVANRDTIPPEVQRVRPRSSRRFIVRFSEAIQLTSRASENWLLADSASGQSVGVEAVYLFDDDPRQVYLRTDSLAATPHRLRPDAALTDSSGNPVRTDTLSFTPTTAADTLRLRFLGFLPDDAAADPLVLPPTAAPGLRFNEPMPATRLAEIVTAQDSTGQPLSFDAETANGTTYRLRFTPALAPGHRAEIRVDGSQAGGVDTVYTRVFQRIAERDLGSLSGIAATDDTSGVLVIELYATDAPTAPSPYALTNPDSTGAFLFDNLPEGPYRFRLFIDRNGNGRWDGGQILPYQPAEPVIWNTEEASVRPRWDSALSDTLRVPAR